MRKTIIILTIALLSLSSCNNWLEATSSTQISADRLFSSRAGFHEALSGVYLMMGSQSCYGADYSWFVTGLAGEPYCKQSQTLFNDLQNRRYTTVYTEPIINSMWREGYNVIANINKILLELENRRDIIKDETEYRLMRGELLGLRAYLHFDIMRIWGLPDWTGDNAGKLTVPYVTSYQKEPTVQLSYDATAALLLKDIDEAISLLEVDPICNEMSESFEEAINADGFWNKRTYHLNWYAARALKARVLMWQHKYSEAAALAKNIIDEVLEKQVVTWLDPVEMVNKTINDERDWTFSCEHIFTLEIPDYSSIVQTYFFTEYKSGGGRILLSNDVVSELYQSPYIYAGDSSESPVTLIGDVRGPALMLKITVDGYYIYKYYTNGSSTFKNKQPMIRLPELYFMCAEAAIHSNDIPGAADAINAVNEHRGIDDKITPTNCDLSSQPEFFLWKEFVREFIAEMPAFDYRKRFTIGPGAIAAYTAEELVPRLDDNLVFPYPTEETSYGHIQEL
ncbi:MAG: RagB/SusD family nutrient uptake outer membrane protein [Bacteroidales bacterium]|nr:RagB/SusD family nutrient uptake outer membrane protein [Bacteroidales bacterium]